MKVRLLSPNCWGSPTLEYEHLYTRRSEQSLAARREYDCAERGIAGSVCATEATDPVKGLLRLWLMKWKDAPVPSGSPGRKIGRGGSWGERTARGKEVPVKCRYKIVVPT